MKSSKEDFIKSPDKDIFKETVMSSLKRSLIQMLMSSTKLKPLKGL